MTVRQKLKPWINEVNIATLREVVGQTTLVKYQDEDEAKLRTRVYREQKKHADYRNALSRLIPATNS